MNDRSHNTLVNLHSACRDLEISHKIELRSGRLDRLSIGCTRDARQDRQMI